MLNDYVFPQNAVLVGLRPVSEKQPPSCLCRPAPFLPRQTTLPLLGVIKNAGIRRGACGRPYPFFPHSREQHPMLAGTPSNHA